jgi:iron(III) transport system substrate-binding protein
MSLTYQLRIDHPEDPLRIYDLDEIKGIATVGQDSTNDVLLKGPGVAPIHLVLDYQQPPYHLTVSDQAQAVTVNDQLVPPGNTCEIHDRDVFQVAGYTLTFRAYGEEPVVPGGGPPSPPQPEPDAPPLPEPPPSPPAPDQPVIPPEEPAEPSILTSLPEQERVWTLDVEQTITLQLTVINAGNLVAQFNVTAEGVPPEWVLIAPPQFNLNERASTTVAITITPPRLPTSQAGTYHLILTVTSPEHYPKDRSQTSADITINPFYELAVSNLSPLQQSIPWSQPSGQTEVPLTNKSNSEVSVALTGEDDALACRFEFQVPDERDEPLHLTRQANLRIPCNKAVRVPVRLIPHHRPLIGAGGRLVDLRPRIHPYTITVMMTQGQQGPWTLTGEWENEPRFSRRALAAATLGLLLLFIIFTCALFTPRIITLDYAQPASIRAGQIVELDWKAWPPFLIGFKLDGESVTPPLVDRPKQTTTYELRADTWLSHLWPAWSATAADTVVVRPVKPDILLFEARPQRATSGQSVVLSWVVDDADELILVDHSTGVQQTLASPYGSHEIQVARDPLYYTLRAITADGTVVEQVVAVQVASPLISVFSVAPTAITSSRNVTLTWEVLGANKATLSRRSFRPSTGEFTHATTSLTGSRGKLVQPVSSTTVFSLSVGSGVTQVVETARVKILKPTPIPASLHTAPHVLTPAPTLAPDQPPDTIIVYTALSQEELEKLELGAMPTASLTELPDSLIGTDLTLEQLAQFDYIVAPSSLLATNILIVRKSTGDLINQLLAEKENPQADVIWMVAATGMIKLRAEGLLEPLAGLYQPQGLDTIKADWRDPTPPLQWLGLSAWQAAFCVNQDKLPKENGSLLVPHKWTDLTDPRYHQQIVMPNPSTSGTGYMVVSGLIQMQPFGEQAGWAYLDLLHENIASYTSSGSEPCDLVEDKNNPQIAIGIAANRCPSGNKPSITIVYPKQGFGWEMDAVALVRKDQISDKALAFLTWAISQDAMEKYAQIRPALSYTAFEPNQTCLAEFAEEPMTPDRFLWASANFERITDQWLSRYGNESGRMQLESAR